MENLWLSYSKGKFGYSVQRDLWRKTKGDFENFCRRIGWTTMDAEVRSTCPTRVSQKQTMEKVVLRSLESIWVSLHAFVPTFFY